jgi:cytochrome c5
MLAKNIRSRAPLLALAAAASLATAMGGQPNPDGAAVLQRIAPVAKVNVAGGAAAAAGKSAARTGEQLYNAFCTACHSIGVAGSPKMGDTAAWAPRIAVGLDALVKSATVGKNTMPPRGGSDASDEELARAIVYMTNKSGADFKEPAAGAKPAGSP